MYVQFTSCAYWVVSFKQVKEVGCSKNTNLPTSPEGKVHIFGKKVSTSLGILVALKCGFYKRL